MAGYERYGISPVFVERIKGKLKDPAVSERVKMKLDGLTKQDLQNRAKVAKLLASVSRTLGENLSAQESANIVNFVVQMKIDPNNTWHLIKLWQMFR